MVITDKKMEEIKKACVTTCDYREIKSRLCLEEYSLKDLITECSQVTTEEDLKKVLNKANRIKSHNRKTNNNWEFINNAKTLIKQLYEKDAIIIPADFSCKLYHLGITKNHKTQLVYYTFKLLEEEGYLKETKICFKNVPWRHSRSVKAYKFI